MPALFVMTAPSDQPFDAEPAAPSERSPDAPRSAGPTSGSSSESDLIANARRDAERLIHRGRRSGPAESALPLLEAIPGYSLEREIHRGGQGVVYLARRSTTGRHVAIKVLRDGPFADAREVLRFEREMQILSRLGHPNIVKILDRGFANGQHWFAMDYIDGPSLDRWLAEGERSRAEVLHVFQRICAAVQAAHVQGVIHRDLKPSNIRLDSSGEPHILDFGLARAAGDAQQLEQTHTGEFIGTPAWTSPEQLARDPHRIDQRTDVYLLGLILFKLLTGRSPAELPRHRDELLVALRMAPPAPSTVRRGIDDELDTIVGTCLAPEQDRRYQSVHALASDIERYRRGEPIEAKRDSRWYLLWVFSRRYRWALAAAAVVAVAISGLSLLSTTQWIRAERAATRERAAWAEAAAAAEAIKAAELVAHRNKAMFAAASELFVDDLLDGAEGADGADEGARLAEILARGAERIGTRFTDPQVQLEFHARFGRTFKSLRQWEPAIHHLGLAVKLIPSGVGSEELRAELLEDLGFSLLRSGRGREALDVQREGLRLRESQASGPSVAQAKSMLGVAAAQMATGAFDEALDLDRAAIEMLSAQTVAPQPRSELPVSLELARAKAALALHLRRLSERRGYEDRRQAFLDEAVELGRSVLAAYEAEPLRGPDHHVTLQALNNLAMSVREKGDAEGALALWNEAIRRWQATAPGHAGAAAPLYNLAGTLAYRLDRPAEALTPATAALAIRRRTLRPDHVELARALSLVAFCHAEAAGAIGGRSSLEIQLATAQALGFLAECEAIHRAQPGGTVPALVRALRARCLLRLTESAEHPALLEELAAAKAQIDLDLPPEDPHRVRLARWLAESRE